MAFKANNFGLFTTRQKRKSKATMSDNFNLPQDLFAEILVRLPIEDLVKSTAVCKSWNSLIKTPTFISTHLEKTISFAVKTLEERRGSAGPVRAGFANSKTALRREICAKIRRGKECMPAFPKFLIASPSFHGGRGALPSAGGHPADLTFLAGGDSGFPAKNGKFEQLVHSHSIVQGMNLPIYCFGSQSLEEDTSFEGHSCITEEESLLDVVLLSQWEDRMRKGCFRYDVTTSEIKVIPGRMKFISQLNEGETMDHLSKLEGNMLPEQNPSVFDCVKHPEELLFCIASCKKAISELVTLASLPANAILVIINVNPVEYGHVFLVPRTSNTHHQFLDARSVEIVTRVAAEINNCSFRVFYNCSKPHSSDVYFQACYFPDPLPVEFRPVDIFFSGGRRAIRICSIIDYPIKTISFHTTCDLKIMAMAISEICSHLDEKNIQYNLMISDSGKTIFLFLQRSHAASHALSTWECGGYFLFRYRYEFDQVTEDVLLKRLRSFSLDEDDFEAVKQLCCSVASKFDI
ncbi:hypothetical protein COLO4_26862 [Corchorus olitorius]|uniref:F-box domain-containing protein n=1 Tax=Corchorus olitorius TaxID=93759 RepID=A0A1R3HTR3_9ROSI|nr:hypothetical protein COLO4_26862 [Corchorus olitorius]